MQPCRDDFPVVVSPLNVITRPGSTKLRLILDLRHVNRALACPEFRYEGLHLIEHLASLNDWQIALDLASGYHHIQMHKDAWPYLCFKWRGKLYYYVVLPFGLSTAPWAFTKLMQVVVLEIRSKGIPVLHYLDDF